jgi:calcium-dependent protein kinase
MTWILGDACKRQIHEDYELGRELGAGSYGVVRLGTHRSDGTRCAIKSIKKDNCYIRDLKNELFALNLLSDYACIPDLVATYEDRLHIHLVLELATGGSFFERLPQLVGFSELEAANYMKQMVEIVKYCHDHGVIHRDLKPENWLMKTDEADAQLMLCDFGFATFVKRDQPLREMVGTPEYVAPEVEEGNGYDQKADVWSLGNTLHLMLSGYRVLGGNQLCFGLQPWPAISDNAKNLVSRMLDPEPSSRIALGEVLAHPWLLGHALNSKFLLFYCLRCLHTCYSVFGFSCGTSINPHPNLISESTKIQLSFRYVSVQANYIKIQILLIKQHTLS